jgi:RHS repeat-associated protein
MNERRTNQVTKHILKLLALLLVWLGGLTGACAAGDAAVYYIHTDQLNTPRVIADGNQQVVWKWDSDGFGSASPNEQPGTAATFAFNPRFAGQYFDRESNLHYNYYRDYDPLVGRYIQSDPIGLDGGVNPFSYVENSPVEAVDPDGLQISRVSRGIYPSGIRPSIDPIAGQAPNSIVDDGGGRSRERETSESIRRRESSRIDLGPMAATSRRSEKERATDGPSWTANYPKGPNEGCKAWAERALNEKYGCDDPRAKRRGPGSEHSQMVKSCERGGR